ncbi:MAG: hypothetical protein FWE63_07525 [Bacteroidales bacterium]|nr:hypothetical protein [Bacteroidales bacterium]
MKNTIKIIMVLVLATSLISCKTVKMADLRPEHPISNKLPSLEPLIDMNSFESAYSLGTTMSTDKTVSFGTWGGVIATGTLFGQTTHVADKRVQDAIVLFEREINDNITLGGNDPIGSAVGRIITGGSKAGGVGWFVLSVGTLMVPNLFGMPLYNYKTELELEVQIRDCNERILGRYQGYGFERTPVALWHGYSGGSGEINHITGNEEAVRKSNIEAFKMAMADIKAKIERDSERLRKELEACNNNIE